MTQSEEYNYHLDKLAQMAIEFDELYSRKEYARAHWIELKAEVIAAFLELPQDTMSEFFGYWPDDGDDEKEPPPGLFNVDKVRTANWYCCVRQHKSYQDIAARRKGLPLQYYSDADYCAFKCPQASSGHCTQIEKMRA